MIVADSSALIEYYRRGGSPAVQEAAIGAQAELLHVDDHFDEIAKVSAVDARNPFQGRLTTAALSPRRRGLAARSTARA